MLYSNGQTSTQTESTDRPEFREAIIANPSAKRFAKPRIKIMLGDKPAPTTPATIAKVVTAPSIDP